LCSPGENNMATRSESREDEFIAALPDNPIQALNAICRRYQEFDSAVPPGREPASFNEYLRHFALVSAYIEGKGLNITVPQLEGENRDHDTGTIRAFFSEIHTFTEQRLARINLHEFKAKFANKLGTAFLYEFSEGDLNRVQQLIDELRKELNTSKLFESNHRSRLLSRLERVQSELHKKVSDLDRLWGLIGDAGVVLGKFGNDAKPFVDRVREIADIVWRTQARAEELPSGTKPPLLENKDQSEI
jgi:hypothetical protein